MSGSTMGLETFREWLIRLIEGFVYFIKFIVFIDDSEGAYPIRVEL